MLTVRVNDDFSFRLETDTDHTFVNGRIAEFDLQAIDSKRLHIIKDNVSYEAEVISFSLADKSGVLKINNNTYRFSITDQYDELLQRMGMDTQHAGKVSELKAPMPGLVLSILVHEGQEVKKGDNLLILEAMKMENIIKSPADVTIRSLRIKPGDKVEKNQVIISF